MINEELTEMLQRNENIKMGKFVRVPFSAFFSLEFACNDDAHP